MLVNFSYTACSKCIIIRCSLGRVLHLYIAQGTGSVSILGLNQHPLFSLLQAVLEYGLVNLVRPGQYFFSTELICMAL